MRSLQRLRRSSIDRRGFSAMALMTGLGLGGVTSACFPEDERKLALTPGPFYQRPFSRLALAWNGSACLVLDQFGPPNEALLIDFVSGDRLTIAHPDPKTGLLEAAFSPDGQTLAVVVAKPTRTGSYTGVSEIHFLDRNGGLKRRIASSFYYREPAFSLDGSHLAYFRDVTGDSSSTGEPDPQPQERQSRALALYERDLATDREQRLDPQAFAGGPALSYGRTGDEIWLRPGEPKELIEGHPDNGVWLGSDKARATGPGIPYDRCALKRRGHPLIYPLQSIDDLSIDLTNFALIGFSNIGALFSNSRMNGSGILLSELYLLSENRLTLIWTGSPNVPLHAHAIARDGLTIAVGDQGALRPARRNSLRLTLLQQSPTGDWASHPISLDPGVARKTMEVYDG